MAESLREKQSHHVLLTARLIQEADHLGYAFTWGEALRSDEQAEINAMGADGRAALAAYLKKGGYDVLAEKILNNTGSGIRGSLHEYKLAVDLNLFDKATGQYLPGTNAHRTLGELWETWGGTWGGRFNDGNHYSIAHEGKK